MTNLGLGKIVRGGFFHQSERKPAIRLPISIQLREVFGRRQKRRVNGLSKRAFAELDDFDVPEAWGQRPGIRVITMSHKLDKLPIRRGLFTCIQDAAFFYSLS